MNEWEVEHLRLVSRYNNVQKNPEWTEEMLDILNTAIADMWALSLSQSTERA